MLKDQLDVIRLLLDELEEVTREAEAVATLAFNVRLFPFIYGLFYSSSIV